jgi:peptidoglycan/xylan/chitin deacetylase (PgdA/CDA1 family)
MIHDLAPLIGRRFSFGVVPDWKGKWPLRAHPDYCRLIRDNADELLLHGYFHQRQRGGGFTSLLTEGSDEMNGLDPEETQRTIARGQEVFSGVFGQRARGFLSPAWQTGHVRPAQMQNHGIEYVMGFFSVQSAPGEKVGLATWTWDCGRFRWLGHIGHGIGRLGLSLHLGVPTLAVHPRDLHRGFWPAILRVTRELLATGYEPFTVSALLDRNVVEAVA